MDWINEKIENIQKKIRTFSLKESLLAYLAFGIFLSFLCFWGTQVLCQRQIEIIYDRHHIMIAKVPGQNLYQFLNLSEMYGELTDSEQQSLMVLEIVREYSGYVYMLLFTAIMGTRFYYSRIKRPSGMLTKAAKEIQKNNLDFTLAYDCKDEMGELCNAFEEMKRELSDNKEKMWDLIEEQKKVNAAFAHDLRTPLTVLKGYSDFLYRFIPEGKISEEKLVSTLKLMSEHIGRLERYSYTMKDIRNFEERKVEKEELKLSDLTGKNSDTIHALNRIGDVQLQMSCEEELTQSLWVDEEMVLEVVDNLLSNAIRYAKTKVEIIIQTEKQEKLLRIYVKDDGEGFSDGKMEQAKGPYHYEKEVKDEGEHFGIGLHIASVLCKKCGGTLELANSIYGGAFASVSFSYKKS